MNIKYKKKIEILKKNEVFIFFAHIIKIRQLNSNSNTKL